jgi:hypothetical protein
MDDLERMRAVMVPASDRLYGLTNEIGAIAPLIEWLLQQFLENPHPISKQDLFYLLVGETALDQFTREISRV